MLDYLLGVFRKTGKMPLDVPRILVFCGAGISEESGLKTFRCENGLWRNHRPEEVCDLRTFHEKRSLVFDFYNERKREMLSARPNEAHDRLAEMVNRFGEGRCSVFTSNVDGLLESAGIKNVVHVHGSMSEVQCLSCGKVENIGSAPFDEEGTCSFCGSDDVKPGVVFFNERAPKYVEMGRAFESAGDFIGDDRYPTVKLVIGTSFSVIKKDRFYLSRSKSVLLDPNASPEGFDVAVRKKATQGIGEAISFVERFASFG